MADFGELQAAVPWTKPAYVLERWLKDDRVFTERSVARQSRL